VFKVASAVKAFKVPLVVPDLMVVKVLKVCRVWWAAKAHKDSKEILEARVIKESKAPSVVLDLTAVKAHRVL
jgi:hypothetical protein